MKMFKAKSSKTGQWETSSCSEGTLENGVCQYDFVPGTLCLHTSVSDRSGKKIYTNDIISIMTAFGECLGVIRFGEYQNDFGAGDGGYIGFFVDWVSGDKKDILRKDLGYWYKEACVVGNIIENDISELEKRNG